MKTCTKCGVSKLPSEFSKYKPSKDGLQYRCKTCANTTSKNWYLNNRDRSILKAKIWCGANPHKIAAKHKRYKESNRWKINANKAKYRASKLQATPPWITPEQAAEISLFYEEAAALRLYTGLEYHVDHIIPLRGKTVCGLHVPWNLQVISAKENLTKSNKL